jgi:hypothetical protein
MGLNRLREKLLVPGSSVMGNTDIRTPSVWKSQLKVLLPFLPFALYSLVSLGLLPAAFAPLLLLLSGVGLLVFGAWNLWRGLVDKNARTLAGGIPALALVILILLQYRGLIDGNLFFYLLIASVGLSWLAQVLLQKAWQPKH